MSQFLPRKFRCSKNIIAVLLLAISGMVGAAEPAITQAKDLLKAGKAAEAFALLVPLEFFQAGDPSYDYLLGVAALDSRNFNAATLAFERVLLVNPNHAGARMDMARAYFELNDFGRATEQFNVVLTLNPPPTVKKSAENFLAAIEAKKKARLPSLTAYVEGTVGYDTNITNVTRDFTNAVFQSFNLPNIQPTGNSIPREDAYVGVNAGLLYTLPQGSDDSRFFGLDGKQKEYFKEKEFRTSSVSGQVGHIFKRDENTYRVGVSLQRNLQDGESASLPPTNLNGTLYGVLASWQHLLDKRTQASLFAQYSLIRFDDLPFSEQNTGTIGASLTKSIDAPLQPIILASVFYSEEHAQRTLLNGTDLSKDVVGLRFAGQITLDPTLDAFASMGYQFRDDTFVGSRKAGTQGQDKLADFTLGMRWKLDKDWSLKPQIAYSRNDSNIPLFTNNRTDYSVTLRREFR